MSWHLTFRTSFSILHLCRILRKIKYRTICKIYYICRLYKIVYIIYSIIIFWSLEKIDRIRIRIYCVGHYRIILKRRQKHSHRNPWRCIANVLWVSYPALYTNQNTTFPVAVHPKHCTYAEFGNRSKLFRHCGMQCGTGYCRIGIGIYHNV